MLTWVGCVLRMSGMNPRMPNIEPLLTRGFRVHWEARMRDPAAIQAERGGRLTADVN